MKSHSLTLTTALLGTLLIGQTTNATRSVPRTPTAASVIARAEREASRENKNVLLIFHASWCGSCRELDHFLARPEIQPKIEANYVTAHIVVWESREKKILNNPGGEDLFARFGGGEGQGIPYIVILNPRNDTLAVSKAKGQNFGYPSDDEGISVFMKMLSSTSHHLSGADADLIDGELKRMEEDSDEIGRLYKPISDDMAKHDYKAAVSACDQAISAYSGYTDRGEMADLDQQEMAYVWRFQALLHIDENKALSQMGQPMGTRNIADADDMRAGVILGETHLSDNAYHAALSVLLAGEAEAATWSSASRTAQAYARLNNIPMAIEYIDKAIARAKTARLVQGGINYLVKLKSGWQSKG